MNLRFNKAMSHKSGCARTEGSNSCECSAKFGCEQTLNEIEFENSIFNACVCGDLAKVQSFINKKHGQVVNNSEKSGYTCLHYATRNNNFEICKLLIKNRANVNATTQSCQSTPLHRACYIGSVEIVELLLENKANPSYKDCDGKNALHKCVERIAINKAKDTEKFIETAKILLKFDSELAYEKDKSFKSPLDLYPELKQYLN